MRRIIVVMVLMMLISCKSIEYIEKEVPVLQTQIEQDTKILYDSIYEKDSVYVYILGDTLIKYSEKSKTKCIFRTDTIIRVDSIPYPVRIKETTVKEVNKLLWWQKVLMWLGAVLGIVHLFKLKNILRK